MLHPECCTDIALGELAHVFERASDDDHGAGVLHVLDRRGALVSEVQLEVRGEPLCLEWDAEGEVAAAIVSGSPRVVLWDMPTREVTYLDVSLRDLTVLQWSKGASYLAVANAKGAAILFHRDSQKRVPIACKHSKTITCMDWSRGTGGGGGLLALGSNDNSVSICSGDGQVLDVLRLPGPAVGVCFAAAAGSGAPAAPGTAPTLLRLAVALSKSVVVYSVERAAGTGGSPLEIPFLPSYGKIVSMLWMPTDYLAVVGSDGMVSVLSVSPSEFGADKLALQMPPGSDPPVMSYCATACLLAVGSAVGSASSVRLFDLDTWTETPERTCQLEGTGAGAVASLAWSPDGQLIAACTTGGLVAAFVVGVPDLQASSPSGRAVMLSSLSEVTVFDAGSGAGAGAGGGGLAGLRGGGSRRSSISTAAAALLSSSPSSFPASTPLCTVALTAEPALLAVGPTHVAAAVNNRVWFHALSSAALQAPAAAAAGKGVPGRRGSGGATPSTPVALRSSSLALERDYTGSVEEVRLGVGCAAVLCDGRVVVHTLPALAEGDAFIGAAAGGPDPRRGGRAASSSSSSAAAAAIVQVALAPRRPKDAPMLTLPSNTGAATRGARVTCLAVAGDFLYFGTGVGTVGLFSLADWALLPASEYRHHVPGTPIASIWPNAAGTRLVVVDGAGGCVLYNPVDARALPIVGAPPGTRHVLWDAADPCVFAAVAPASGEVCAFVYSPVTMTGPAVARLGLLEVQPSGDTHMEPSTTRLPPGSGSHGAALTPLSLSGGVLACYAPGGAVRPVTLLTHEPLVTPLSGSSSRSSQDGKPSPVVAQAMMRRRFAQFLALQRLEDAWAAAVDLEDRSCWLALGGKAMELCQVSIARRAHIMLGDAAMVQSLEPLGFLSDRTALAGHMALLFNEPELAQELFLASSLPREALELRKDTQEWEPALRLAQTLAPAEVPALSLELGKAQEARAEFPAALSTYTLALERATAALEAAGGAKQQGRENGAAEAEAGGAAQQLQQLARVRTAAFGGVARMSLRCGDVRRGVAMATESGDKTLCRDCAVILEAAKQFTDAAGLFRRAELWNRAASVLISTKAFAAVAPLMPLVTSTRLLAAYAKAREAARDYREALEAYERAGDTDACVRILLDHLKDPVAAAAIVRRTRTPESASALAKFCVASGDVRGGVEFLLLSHQKAESFALAAAHNEMKLYAHVLRVATAAAAAGTDVSMLLSELSGVPGTGASADGSGGAASAAASLLRDTRLPPDDCVAIGTFLEKQAKDPVAAAPFFTECGQFSRALALYLSCGEAELDRAIEVVGQAKSEAVTRTLIDFLMGEADGAPKDPRYIFKLYMALGNYPQAGRTALVIARQEQELGNYKVAHAMLLDTHRALGAAGVRVPADLSRQLMLCHSYLLVKRLVRQENHEAAARMMLRVTANLSRFPAHVVPILTSTVIECQRAGLKRSAYENACVLMRPEHRNTVDEKFRRKIEALVRRPSTEEAPEGSSPCPFCDTQLPCSELACESCKNVLPFCIASGSHVTLAEAAVCPHCRFPANGPALRSFLSTEHACPMCSVPLEPDGVAALPDPGAFLSRLGAGGGPGGTKTYES